MNKRDKESEKSKRKRDASRKTLVKHESASHKKKKDEKKNIQQESENESDQSEEEYKGTYNFVSFNSFQKRLRKKHIFKTSDEKQVASFFLVLHNSLLFYQLNLIYSFFF